MKKTFKIVLATLIATIVLGGTVFAVGAIAWGGSQDVVAIEGYIDTIDNILKTKTDTIKDLEKQLEGDSKRKDELKQAEKDVKRIKEELENIIKKYEQKN